MVADYNQGRIAEQHKQAKAQAWRSLVDRAIITAAWTATFAVLASAAALGWATGLALGTAQAAPGGPSQPNGDGRLYGDPAAAAPFWRRQTYDDDCVLMAVADVVGQLTGNEPAEEEIIRVAQSTPSTAYDGPIYAKFPHTKKSDYGTYFEDEPALLAHYGIHAVYTHKDMEALEHDLGDGHKVIAGVNEELILGKPVKTKTPDGRPFHDHALIVTGVDTAAGIVHLNDSDSHTGRDEQVAIEIFVQSWATSDNQMTVTG